MTTLSTSTTAPGQASEEAGQRHSEAFSIYLTDPERAIPLAESHSRRWPIGC
jgi:hypothetical protein